MKSISVKVALRRTTRFFGVSRSLPIALAKVGAISVHKFDASNVRIAILAEELSISLQPWAHWEHILVFLNFQQLHLFRAASLPSRIIACRAISSQLRSSRSIVSATTTG